MKSLIKVRDAILKFLAPLGIWGVFGIAVLDGAGVPLPGAVDIVFATQVYNKSLSVALLYALVTSIGSAIGCLVLYFIGYGGGEVLLRKHMNPAKFEKTRLSFENHRLLALMLPAMLPPPFPFKIFVLSAAAFEMKISHFLIAIISGRLVRFVALAVLTVEFGPGILRLAGTAVHEHLGLVLLGLAVLLALWLSVARSRRSPARVIAE